MEALGRGDPAQRAVRPSRGQATLLRSVIVAMVLVSIGCAQRQPPARAAAEAAVDYQLLPAGGEGRAVLQPGEAASGGAPDTASVVLPDYPPAWLPARLPDLRVAALVVVDGDGLPARISVDQAPLQQACGACAADFAASVERALGRWRFTPLAISTWVDGPDEDGDGEPDSVRRGSAGTRPYSLRIAFRFGWREGRAVVDHSP
jgi:hypothetical protein